LVGIWSSVLENGKMTSWQHQDCPLSQRSMLRSLFSAIFANFGRQIGVFLELPMSWSLFCLRSSNLSQTSQFLSIFASAILPRRYNWNLQFKFACYVTEFYIHR
jgi:hypothetical protein